MKALDQGRFLEEQVAQDYRKKGYDVVLSPSAKDLPAFLRGFRPDLVAKKPKENIVVEVKRRDQLRGEKWVAEMARLLESKKGWRFELVLTGPEKTKAQEFLGKKLISWAEIRAKVAEAEELLRTDRPEAALLLGWTSVEAALRHLAKEEGFGNKPASVNQLLEFLVFQGVVGRGDYQATLDLLEVRNSISHGLAHRKVSSRTVKRLLALVPKLEAERRPAPSPHPAARRRP